MAPKPRVPNIVPKSYRPNFPLSIAMDNIRKSDKSQVKMKHLENNSMSITSQYGSRRDRRTIFAIPITTVKLAITRGLYNQTERYNLGLLHGLNERPPVHIGCARNNRLPWSYLDLISAATPKLPLLSSVPQGTVPSPTLFRTYTVDIPPTPTSTQEGNMSKDIQ